MIDPTNEPDLAAFKTALALAAARIRKLSEHLAPEQLKAAEKLADRVDKARALADDVGFERRLLAEKFRKGEISLKEFDHMVAERDEQLLELMKKMEGAER